MQSDLLNKKATKKFILHMCEAHRSGHEFNRVSAEAISELNLWLKAEIIRRVKGLPSLGKTVKW
jgi:hypothetical protein